MITTSNSGLLTKRNIIIAAIVLGVLILLLSTINMFRTGGIEITIPKTPNDNAVKVTIINDDGSTQQTTIPSNSKKTVSAKTGTVRVNSTVNELKAVNIVTVKAFETQKITVDLGDQAGLSLLATDARFCPYIIENTVYTYNCQGEGFIYKHTSPQALKIPIVDSQFFMSVTPYANGFLAFPYIDPNDDSGSNLALSFIDAKANTITKLSLPAPLQQIKDLSAQANIITTKDPSKKEFVIFAGADQKAYLFKDMADANPTEIKLPDNRKFYDSPNRVTIFSFKDDTLLAYNGNLSNDVTDDGITNDGSGYIDQPDNTKILKSDGKIFEYNMSGTVTKTITAPDDFDISSITKLNDDYYAIAHVRGIDVFFVRDGTMNRVYRLADGADPLVSKGNLYMNVDAGLFEFKPTQNGLFELKNIYNNDDIRISSVFDTPKGLVVTGIPKDQQLKSGQESRIDVFSVGLK